jgi:hypothetical protein
MTICRRSTAIAIAFLSLALPALVWAQPAGVPRGAVPIGPFASAPGIDGMVVQAAVIGSIQTQMNHGDDLAAQAFAGACSDWTFNAQRDQTIGIAIPAKPTPYTHQVVHTLQLDKNSPVWVWATDGAVDTCPDLPPAPTPASGLVVHVGVNLYGNWYQSAADDNSPDGYVAVNPPGLPSGSYLKVRSPFGGWYLKQ